MHNIPKFMGHSESSVRGTFKALNASIKKLGSSHTSNLKLHLNALGKKNWSKHSQEDWALKAENNQNQGWNQSETKKQYKKINEIKSWILEKINTIDKTLDKLAKRQR